MTGIPLRVVTMVIAVLVVALAGPVHAAGKVHKLGLSLAITGPTSDAGNPYAKGVEDYFKLVNDTKMLGDDTIDCIIRDDQYNNDITKRNFEDFLSQDIIFYLGYSTGSILALKKDFEEERIAVMPASFHAGNTQDSNYVFLPIASYSAQLIGLGEYLAAITRRENPRWRCSFIHRYSVAGRWKICRRPSRPAWLSMLSRWSSTARISTTPPCSSAWSVRVCSSS
jgi:branched-chain amino acid transport system substrate-binding protein